MAGVIRKIDEFARIGMRVIKLKIVARVERLPVTRGMMMRWREIARELPSSVVNPSVQAPLFKVVDFRIIRDALARRAWTDDLRRIGPPPMRAGVVEDMAALVALGERKRVV